MLVFRLLCILACGIFAGSVVQAGELPDISSVPPDLTTPEMKVGQPEAGKRVKAIIDEYRDSDVYHSLYLPSDWQPGQSYPVIVEYAGNGPFRNKYGDVCTGKVEDCNLGYGISGGKGFIWICLPYVSVDRQHNQLEWWGDIEATVEYCKTVVPRVCKEYGGNPEAVFLAGFSRGSIACNFVGLHEDEIATLWCGFICHGHYDGVREWDYPEATGQSAIARLNRLAGRPQFISNERSVEETRKYLLQSDVSGDFTFEAIPYRNHTDSWVLRDIAERRKLRDWVTKQLK